MSKRKAKEVKPCWQIGVRQDMARWATVEVRAWTKDEAIQMAVRGDVRPAVEWQEGDWSSSTIARDGVTGEPEVRQVECDG